MPKLGSVFQSRGTAAWKALSLAIVFVFGMWSREVLNEEQVVMWLSTAIQVHLSILVQERDDIYT